MKIYDVEQGTPEWHEARLGIPTASNFHRIISPTGLKSKQDEEYILELLAEMITGEYEDMENTTVWMNRGKELEPEAVKMYTARYKVEPKKVGFVTDDARTMGCSPDMLVGDKGGLEIKCMKGKNQVRQLFTPLLDEKHKPQIQGAMVIIGADYWDAMAYHPKIPPVYARAVRDEGFIKMFLQYHSDFMEKLAAKKYELEKMGVEFHA